MLYSYIYIDIFLSLSAHFLCQTKGEEAGAAAGTNQEHLSHLLALPDIVVMLFL